MIYLDNAATTKVAPEVLDAMMPYLTTEYGNAGSLHKMGRNAEKAMEAARAQVSSLFNCKPEHIIFTSGGSEGNSMVFNAARHLLEEHNKRHIVVSAVEHDSVVHAVEELIKCGFDVTYVQPNENGVITSWAVEDAIREDTGLVSVMFVNNETGAINDVSPIGEVCREHSVLFHSDCVQAAGQYVIDVDRYHIDFATISAHKLHGAKGAGAIYVRDPHITPLIFGGEDQEFGLRGGTENVAGVVGLGKACELTVDNLKEDSTHNSILKQAFFAKLKESLPDPGIIHVNGRPAVASGKIINLRVDGVDSQSLVLMMDAQNVCISAGSACRSNNAEPSRVLTAMGLSPDEARNSVRVSFSRYNTVAEAGKAAYTMAQSITTLRAQR